MTRIVLVAGAAVAFLLGSLAANEASAQARGGTTGGIGGGTTGGGFGGTTGGFGGTTGQTGGFGQTAGGLAAGYGGFGGQALGGQQIGQQRNLTTLLNQNRNQQLTTQPTQNLQNLVPIRLQVPLASVRSTTPGPAVAVSARMSRVLTTGGRAGLAAPVAMWEGDVLVLGGVVANESVRRQIEGIALLEPGVRSVRNDMVVGAVPQPPAVANTAQ